MKNYFCIQELLRLKVNTRKLVYTWFYQPFFLIDTIYILIWIKKELVKYNHLIYLQEENVNTIEWN